MEATMDNQNMRRSSVVPMIIVGGLFFVFGFVTWLNGSLIPFLQIACELNHIEAYLVTMAFYIAYTVTALPMSAVLRRTGYRNGMMLGLLIMAVGALVFIPAAETRSYAVFLVALFILGTGLTVLQSASNPYIVHIGPQETAAVRISIMGLLNKGAGIVAPAIFTAFILSDMSQFSADRLASLDEIQRAIELSELSARLVMPYMIMAVMLVILAGVIKFSPLPEIEIEEPENAADENTSILQFPQLVLGAIALFFYVGVEVIAGDTIGLFGKEMGVSNFGQLTSYTMAFMVSAYILGLIVIPRWIKQETALVISGSLGIVLTILVMTGSSESTAVWSVMFGWTGISAIPNAVLFVALLGFANALVWPAIWPMALKNLGKHTSTGSALLIMGISGGAIFPLIYGALAESSGDPQSAYWIMIPCYLFILFYALKGHKKSSW
ncbi:MAG: FHS family L-fucose permease-like MFS transporter [Flavobacteriales bacterium]